MSGRKTEKLLSLLLITVLLTGCGRAWDSKDITSEEQNSPIEGTESVEGPEEVGQRETLQEVSLSEVPAWQGKGGCFTGEVLIFEKFLSRIKTYGQDIYALYLEDLNTDLVMRQLCLEDRIIYESPYLRDFTLGEDGIWIYREDTLASSKDRCSLLLLGYDGEEILSRNIMSQIKRSIVSEMYMDSNQRLYLLLSDSVAVYDREGNFLGSIYLDYEGQKRLIRGNDGTVYVILMENLKAEDGRGNAVNSEIFRLDADSLTASPVRSFDGYYVSDGGGDYLVTLNDNTGYYGVNRQGELETIAVWEELGLGLDQPFRVQWLSEGRYLVNSRGKTVLLTPADPAVIKDKSFLVLACFDASFHGVISEFNQQNISYAIRMQKYMKGDEIPLEEALRQLDNDIMEGDAPDLIDFTMIPPDYLTDRGLAVDLWPLIDQDSELDRKDFILLEKLGDDGSLYLFPQSYQLRTAGGLWSRFGDRYGWTLEEYLSIQSEAETDVMYNITKENFLRMISYRYASQVMDWKKRTCNFDSEEFISILEGVAQIRENAETGNPANSLKGSLGTRLREGSLIAAAWDIDDVTKMAILETDAGEKLSFVGLPDVEGADGTTLIANSPIGICSRGNTEGAWEFLRFVMMRRREEKGDTCLPVSRKLLEEEYTKATENSGEGVVILKEEDRQRFYELLEHSVYYRPAYEKAVDIIMEEAAPFLKGRRTAETTAQAIQVKISTLMAE